MKTHVAITGASSGIGAALAREFAAHGAHVTLVARRKQALEELAAELPQPSFVVEQDLSDLAHACDWIPGAEEKLGPIDVLINNAGIQIVAPTVAVAPEQGEAVIRLDLLVPLRLTHAILPGMIARGRGTVVDISSMAALAPTPGMTHYNAAKAGLAAASEALRGELRPTGIHVVTVYPGIIGETAMARSALAKYQAQNVASWIPQGTAAELAKRVRRAVEKRRDRVIFPSSMALSRWFPAATHWVMDRWTPRLKDDNASRD